MTNRRFHMATTSGTTEQVRCEGLPPSSCWVSAAGGVASLITVPGFDAFVTREVRR